MCEVLPATHALTCCDSSSKFGTKAADIKAEPVLYLKVFGGPYGCAGLCAECSEVPGTSVEQRETWH